MNKHVIASGIDFPIKWYSQYVVTTTFVFIATHLYPDDYRLRTPFGKRQIHHNTAHRLVYTKESLEMRSVFYVLVCVQHLQQWPLLICNTVSENVCVRCN